ncbi:MAG: hypothetical protein AAF569_00470 [Pseudomonadota bacterium]
MTNTTRPTLNIDLQEFVHFLDEVEGTDEEKQEYLELIWQICCEFALLGMGLNSVQLAQQSCGKDHKTASITAQGDSPALDSKDKKTLVSAFIESQDLQKNEEENAYA